VLSTNFSPNLGKRSTRILVRRTTHTAVAASPASSTSVYATSWSHLASESSRRRPDGAQSANPGHTTCSNTLPSRGRGTSSESTERVLEAGEEARIGCRDSVHAELPEAVDRDPPVHGPRV